MKIFWPRRSKAKGFSIQNLNFKYHEKTSNSSPNQTSDQFLSERNFKSIIEECNQIDKSTRFIKRFHWANRDFSEYKNTD